MSGCDLHDVIDLECKACAARLRRRARWPDEPPDPYTGQKP